MTITPCPSRFVRMRRKTNRACILPHAGNALRAEQHGQYMNCMHSPALARTLRK